MFSNITPMVLACAALTGFASLTYEVLWIRRLALVFGHTTLAMALASGAFMVGLAAGGWASTAAVGGQRSAWRLLAVIEMATAVLGALSPWALSAVEAASSALLWRRFPEGGSEAAWFPLFLVVLVAPAALMGAALPVLARADGGLEREGRFGLLYGVNAFGAALGAAGAGLAFVPAIGMTATALLASCANAACAVAAWLASSREGDAPLLEGETAEVAPSAFMAAAAIGAAGLACQTVWLRGLQMALGPSTYVAALLLAAVLLGASAGGWACRFFSRVRWMWAVTAFAAAILIQVFFFERVFYWSALWLSSPAWSFAARLAAQAACVVVVAAVPTALLNWAFARLVEDEGCGRSPGPLLAGDALGCAVGSFVGAFILLPRLGLRGLLLFIAASTAAAGGVAALRSRRDRFAGAVGLLCALACLAVPPWSLPVLASGPYLYGPRHDLTKGFDGYSKSASSSPVLYYSDGLSSTVSVRQDPSGNRYLQVDGKTDASTTSDMLTQSLLGWLPLALHPEARRVAVVGLGSGMTAAAVAESAWVEKIDIIEVEPKVAAAAAYFEKQNARVLSDPRVSVVFTDARHFFATRPGTYDAVVAEPSNPWLAGSAGFYTRESMLDIRSRLASGGVFALWFHSYSMDDAGFKTVLATFASVFPRVALFRGGLTTDYVLAGFVGEPRVEEGRWRSLLLASPGLANDLARFSLDRLDAILGGPFVLDDAGVRAYAATGRVDRDEKPLLEFEAPKVLYRQDDLAIYSSLEGARRYDWPPFLPVVKEPTDTARRLARVGAAVMILRDSARALRLLQGADTAMPGNPEIRTNLARLLIRGGLPREGEKLLLAVAQRYPRYAPARFHLADFYAYARGELDTALRWSLEGLRLSPDDPRGGLGAGALLISRGRSVQAQRVLERALRSPRLDRVTRRDIEDRLRPMTP